MVSNIINIINMVPLVCSVLHLFDAFLLCVGISRYAFVDYGTPEKAREALKMNGAEIRGKRIIVDIPRFTREQQRKQLL